MRKALAGLALTAAMLVAVPPASAADPRVHLRDPGPIASGPDGNLWVADDIGIVRVTTSGRLTRMATVRYVRDVANGPDGAVWFTTAKPQRVWRIAPDGALSHVNLPRQPGSLTAGADGNIWVGEYGPAGIARVTPGGAVTEFSDGLLPYTSPEALSPGPDGNIWFGDGFRVGRVTPQGAVVAYPIQDEVGGLTAGPDGALWFTATRQLGRITTAGHVRWYDGPSETMPEIVAGPDGNLWFTTWPHAGHTARVARMTTAGRTRLFDRGFTGVYTIGIANGPDGNLWVTESGRTGGHVVRVTPAGVATEFPRRRRPCRVPWMPRYTLAKVKRSLFWSRCELDPASARKGRKPGTIVLAVSPAPGSVHPYGTRVHVEFGPPPPLPRHCGLPLGARVEASSKRVLVFAYDDYAGGYDRTTYGACLRPRGRPHTIEIVEDYFPDYAVVEGFVTRGTYVAYHYEEDSHYGGESKTLVLYDVAGAREVARITVESFDEGGYSTLRGAPSLRKYVVSRHGALAWFSALRKGIRLSLYARGKRRLVDFGDLTKLRFDGDVLKWRKRGADRSLRVG